MSGAVCPATMCPLFAADGSPWTGEKNAPCLGHDDTATGGCPWWSMGCSGGGPHEQVGEAIRRGSVMVAGPKRQQPSRAPRTPRTYDCPRASVCQWQIRSGEALCPPRAALAAGVDPRNAAF